MFRRFYWRGKNFTNKICLFYTTFWKVILVELVLVETILLGGTTCTLILEMHVHAILKGHVLLVNKSNSDKQDWWNQIWYQITEEMKSLLIILSLYICIDEISSNNDHCPCPKIPTHDPYGIALAIDICRAVNKCDGRSREMGSLNVQDSSVSTVWISVVSDSCIVVCKLFPDLVQWCYFKAARKPTFFSCLVVSHLLKRSYFCN